MKSTGIWYIVAVCGAVAFLGSSLTRGSAQSMPPTEVQFQTGCAPVDPNTVEGFVTNPGTTIIRIDGMVRFSFTTAGSMSRPSLQVMGSAVVPPGRTLSVTRARLPWELGSNESCQFDITGAVR